MMAALLIELGLKSAVICGAALFGNHVLRMRPAAERVALLRVAIGALLILPLLAVVLPAIEIGALPGPEPMSATSGAAAQIGAMPAQAQAHWEINIVMVLYGAGAALILLRLVAGIVTLQRWTMTAVPASDESWAAAATQAGARLRRPVRLLVSPHVAAPLSWGLAPVWLLISPATERRREQAAAVIAHEMAHVRRLDWPILIAAQIATALFWFNPLVWLVERELGRQVELAADDEALEHVAQSDYAQAP